MGFRTLRFAITLSLVGVCRTDAGKLSASEFDEFSSANQWFRGAPLSASARFENGGEISQHRDVAEQSASSLRFGATAATTVQARLKLLGPGSLGVLLQAGAYAGQRLATETDISRWPTVERIACPMQIGIASCEPVGAVCLPTRLRHGVPR